MGRNDWASATQMFRAAVQLDPNLVQAHAGLGAALGNQGLWSLSVEAHSRALELEPPNVDTIYNLGVAYGELGRAVESADHFRRVLDARPGDHETMVRLGTELAEQERFVEAVEYFQAVARAGRQPLRGDGLRRRPGPAPGRHSFALAESMRRASRLNEPKRWNLLSLSIDRSSPNCSLRSAASNRPYMDSSRRSTRTPNRDHD